MPNPNPLFAFFLLLGPISLLLFGISLQSWVNKKPYYFSVLASWIAFGVFLSSLVSVGFLILYGPLFFHISLNHIPIEILYFDQLSALVLVLISFLLFMVLRFSYNYMKGDPHQGRFTQWLCLTGSAVLFIVLSGNLILLSLAWISSSLALHQLLEFYPERPGALLAARKKFIISRIGDACMIGAIFLVYHQFHTWNFKALFDQGEILLRENRQGFIRDLNPTALLLVAGAMLKSAQFPFHSWLPDTMETPTPVSALMHAGIINAGGFLIIRMGSLVEVSHPAMATLAFFGAITALLGSLVMLTHSSIKRTLAFSTIAQMGFMMLECGLGAFSLALLHLVSHSLYKAYAFLSSGTLKGSGKSFLSPLDSFRLLPLGLSFIISSILVFGFSLLLKILDLHNPPGLVLTLFFSLSLGYFLWNLWSQKWDLGFFILGTLGGTGICLGYLTLHKIFQDYILVSVSHNFQTYSLPEFILMGFLVAIFVLVLYIQIELPKKSQNSLLSALYVHARNGFYFNTLFNKWSMAFWPIKKKPNS